MKTKKLATKLVAWVLWVAIFATQASAGMTFWWWWGWWTPESYIINNAELMQWWNEKFEKYQEKYVTKLKKVAEKWWLTQLKIKLPWWEDLKYEPDANDQWKLTVAYTDKISLTSDKNWNITITPPSNASFKWKYEYSYIIPWVKNEWFSNWNSTTWVKTYSNMYNATNKWKTIVFTIKDAYWNKTYITSKLWWISSDLANISGNKILDYYE
jgi:hypothetical protein